MQVLQEGGLIDSSNLPGILQINWVEACIVPVTRGNVQYLVTWYWYPGTTPRA